MLLKANLDYDFSIHVYCKYYYEYFILFILKNITGYMCLSTDKYACDIETNLEGEKRALVNMDILSY